MLLLILCGFYFSWFKAYVTFTPAFAQGMYSFEANQVVRCMYQQSNLVMDQQTDPNTYQPPNYFSNHHDSPGQSQLLQVLVDHLRFCDVFRYSHMLTVYVLPCRNLLSITHTRSPSLAQVI